MRINDDQRLSKWMGSMIHLRQSDLLAAAIYSEIID